MAADTPLASDPDMILGLIWASPGKEITDLGGRGRYLYFSIEINIATVKLARDERTNIGSHELNHIVYLTI